jgi:quinol monooxygenase YgiN
MSLIHVIATIETAPGRRDDFLAEFRRLVPQVHAEKGCLEYGPACDTFANLPAQPALRVNTVTVIEKWESLEALHAHLAAPHMISFRTRVKDLVAGITLHVLTPA